MRFNPEKESSMKKIAIILGHPNPDSYCASLAQTYAKAAEAGGHTVQWIDLPRMQFDPILHAGYRQSQTLEPDLLAAQETLRWAEHWVFVYPIWWDSVPALLKGFFDRTLTPGFAFAYRKNSPWWDKLMTGRSAQVIATLDTPAWYFRWVYRMPGHNQIKRTILEWIGVKPVKFAQFGPLHGSSDSQRARWQSDVANLARRLR
jgi:NAD(P)H dehydrogenase (quinone)